MHLIGRYMRVREFGPSGWGLPYMIDYRLQKMSPYTDTDEWHRTNEGLWIRAIRGGSGFGGDLHYPVMIPFMVSSLTIQAGITRCSDNYVAGSGGSAVGTKGVVLTTKTIVKILFYAAFFLNGGTAVDDVDFEFRADDASNGRPDTTGGGLLATGVMDPNSVIGWHQFSSFSGDMTWPGGAVRHLIVGDADGGAVANNCVDVSRYSSHPFAFSTSTTGWRNLWGEEATTAGWSGNFFHDNRMGMIAAVFDDGTVIGQVLTTHTLGTNNQLQKGFRFATGFAEKIKIAGAWMSVPAAGLTGINLWRGTAGPGGSVETGDAATIVPIRPGVTTKHGALFSSARTLGKAEPFRMVCTYNANTTAPAVYSLGSIATASVEDLRKAMFAQGAWHATEEIAGPAWQDNLNGLPDMALYVEDQEEVTGNGGGGGGGTGRNVRTRPWAA